MTCRSVVTLASNLLYSIFHAMSRVIDWIWIEFTEHFSCHIQSHVVVSHQFMIAILMPSLSFVNNFIFFYSLPFYLPCDTLFP
jgi:hypothetical protein